jgi:hypothetical protein
MYQKIVQCIDHYLEKYDIVFRDSSDSKKDVIEGAVRIFKNNNEHEYKLGHIMYMIDKQTKNLHINHIYIPKSKHKPPITFTKILLAFLFAKYHLYIETSTLTAQSNEYKKGQEFCLLCIYQRLGFEPYDLTSKKMINYLKKCNIAKDTKDTCILCICQKETKLDDVDLSLLYVDMKVLLPNLKKIINELSKEIHCKI